MSVQPAAPLPLEGAWQDNDAALHCPLCTQDFSILHRRRHHCRFCGRVVCADCSREGYVPVAGSKDANERPRACRTCEARSIVAGELINQDLALEAEVPTRTCDSIPSGILEQLDAAGAGKDDAAPPPPPPPLAVRLLDAAIAEARARHCEERRQFAAGQRRQHRGGDDESLCAAAPYLRATDPLDPVGWAPAAATDATLPATWRDVATAVHLPPDVLGSASVDWLRSLSFPAALLFKWVAALPLTPSWSVAASTKFLTLRRLCFHHGLRFRVDDPDVAAGLALGVFHTAPVFEPTEGCPVIAQLPRRLRWAEANGDAGKPGAAAADASGAASSMPVTPEQMTRAWFYALLAAASTAPTAQTVGLVLLTDCEGAAYANTHSGFMRAVQGLMQAMPVRVRRVIVGNEPGWFRTLLWPVIRAALSDKMKQRVSVIGAKRRDQGEPILAALPASCVPTGMGGTRDMDSAAAVAEMIAALRMSVSPVGAQPSTDDGNASFTPGLCMAAAGAAVCARQDDLELGTDAPRTVEEASARAAREGTIWDRPADASP